MRGNATHQAALLAIMATGNGSPMLLDQLDAALPIGRKQIATAAAELIARAYIERRETGVYALTETGKKALEDGQSLTSGPHRGRRKHPVYPNSLQQRAWSAMRLSCRFTIGDIVTIAATEDDQRPEQSLQRYFHRLTRAGYLVELPTRVAGNKARSNGLKQWMLVRDTGEYSPRWLEKQQAFKDWNTREVFLLPGASTDEVAA